MEWEAGVIDQAARQPSRLSADSGPRPLAGSGRATLSKRFLQFLGYTVLVAHAINGLLDNTTFTTLFIAGFVLIIVSSSSRARSTQRQRKLD